MATYRFEVALKNTSGLGRDDAINTLYYSHDTFSPTTISGICDEIKAKYVLLVQHLNSAYSGMRIKVFDHKPPGIPSGPPILVKDYVQAWNGGAAPTEIALCLSYSADDNAAGTKRRRGRIYLPWGTPGIARPSTLQMNVLLDFGEGLAQVGLANNDTWKMYSPTNDELLTIESISVDNEWDTQRRRGMRATLRTRRDVQ